MSLLDSMAVLLFTLSVVQEGKLMSSAKPTAFAPTTFLRSYL